jgi:hypothetical protein
VSVRLGPLPATPRHSLHRRSREHVPVLIDRAPEITELTLDANEHRIEEPLVAWTRTAALQCVCEELTEAQTPLSNGLVAVTIVPRAAGIGSTSRRLRPKQ